MSGDKPWNRPWSMDEMLSNADTWSLAGDAALLNTLKAFADGLLSRTNEINANLQNLTNDLDKTSLELNIAQNEFRGLRNTQFIESRVYEDDESLPEEEPKPKEEDKVDHTEDVKLAALKGLEILDKYFDKVEVSVSDSEDEDIDLPNFVLRPKDLYINRPLPYVIGSEEWHRTPHVGLEDTSSDSEAEKESDEFSESDSESDLPIIQDRTQVKGTSDTSSELDFSKIDSKGKEFANSSDSESSAPAAPNPNFAEQLAAKLGTVVQDYEPEVNRRPIQPPRSNYGDIFFDEPPPLDEPKGLFSGGGGLFDDDEEKFEPAASTTRGLFDGDSDEDIFGKGAPAAKPPLFSEEPPDLEEKKKPIGGVSIFGGGNVFDKKLLRRRQESSEEEQDEGEEKKTEKKEEKKIDLFGDDDLFKTSSNKNEEKLSDVSSGFERMKKTVNLFDSDEEEARDLFVEKKTESKPQEEKTEKVPPKVEEKPKQKTSLFEDDDLFNDDLFSSNTKKSFTSGLFDDIPEDDLFEKPSLFEDLDVPEEGNSINRKPSLDRDSIVSDVKATPPPKSDFLASTPQPVPTPSMRLFDPSPPPDDDWDAKSENLENLSENEDLDFGDSKGEKVDKMDLFRDEPPSLDFKPSPKKPGKLKHNLNINVGALMPGSAPPKRAERATPAPPPDDVRTPPPAVTATSSSDIPAAVTSRGDAPVTSLDETDRVEVLHSVTKDRARVPLRRRPSTRRGRKEALRNSVGDFKLENEDGVGNFEDKLEENVSLVREEDDKVLKIEEKQEEKMMVVEENVKKVSKLEEKVSKMEERPKENVKSLFDESSESDDLFAGLGELSAKDDIFDTSRQMPESELFGNVAKDTEDDDLFVPKTLPKHNLFGEELQSEKDDLFGTPTTPDDDLFETKPVDLFASVNPPQTEDIFSEELTRNLDKDLPKTPRDDALFEKVPKVSTKIEERKPEGRSKNSIFDDDDDEDDLFASKKTVTKTKKALFDDADSEDDDIFKSFSSASVRKTESKVAAEKKIPKISSVKKLENTTPDDDPLSALLK